MKVPKRTAASTPNDLIALYEHIYPGGIHAIAVDEAYRQSRRRGVDQCHVWINRGACPHAVESTMALVDAQQFDEDMTTMYAHSTIDHTWSLRASYAMAITRFVNALADEMQKGAYAQSIFSIAERIGLPTWFVELRHASTHEELPSLDVLRHASVEALGWLQKNFWMPNVHKQNRILGSSTPSSAPQQQQQQQSDDANTSSFTTAAAMEQDIFEDTADKLRVQLATYRRLAKQVVRDASLRGPSRNALSATQARVVACVRHANSALIRHRQHQPTLSTTATVQAWEDACDVLAAVFVEPGHLVPLARQKRLRPTAAETTVDLPASLADVWVPLLEYVSKAEETFAGALLDSLLDSITCGSSSSGTQTPTLAGSDDLSVRDTTASWLLYLFGMNGPFRSKIARGKGEGDREEGHVVLSVVQRCLSNPSKQSIAVARQFCQQDGTLMQSIGHLIDLAQPMSESDARDGLATDKVEASVAQSGNVASAEDVKEDAVSEMEKSILAMERQLDGLRKRKEAKKGATKRKRDAVNAVDGDRRRTIVETDEQAASREQSRQRDICALLPGWSVVPTEAWQATPIGCLDGKVPRLELHLSEVKHDKE